ncbi:PAS domain S-box protein [bacterium]|nr:PAS domain S-box protein [bacterium]
MKTINDLFNCPLHSNQIDHLLIQIIEQGPHSVIITDAEGRIKYVNAEFTNVTQYKADEVLGKNPRILKSGKQNAYFYQNMWKRLCNKKSWTGEFCNKKKDGSFYYEKATIYPILDNKKDIAGFFAFKQDISCEKESKQKTEQHDTFQEELINTVHDGIGIVDTKEIIQYCNPAFASIFEVPLHQLIGKNLLQFFNKKDREIILKQTEKRKQGESSIYELPLKTQRNHVKWLRVSISPRYNLQGEFSGAFGVIRDITNEKEVYNKLRENQANLQDFFDNASELIQQCDSNGRIINVNNAWCKKLGFSKQEAMQMTYEDVIHSDHLAIYKKMYHSMKQGKKIYNMEIAFKRKNGKPIPVLANVNGLFRNGQFIHSRGIFVDISSIKQGEIAQKQYAEELKRSNEQLEQFAYVASHDLQEPLRMITSYLQLLQRRYKNKLDEDANTFIKYAVDGANRMTNMIRALLQYSRVGTRGHEFIIVDSNKALQLVLMNLDILIKDRQAKVTHEKLPQINADESQLHQLFQNLISNSLKFHGQSSPEIHISAVRLDDYWKFAIKDNGIGISSEDIKRIFTIFQRAENVQKIEGMGIGLSICKRIVDRHGGKIWVDSVKGKGSTFYFTLPEADASEK